MIKDEKTDTEIKSKEQVKYEKWLKEYEKTIESFKTQIELNEVIVAYLKSKLQNLE